MGKDIAAFVCAHVFDQEKLVLYVSRADGDWVFFCGESHPEIEFYKSKIVGVGEMMELDPSLLELKSLPEEWEAERTGVGFPWQKRMIAK